MTAHSSFESGLIVTAVCKLIRETGLATLATLDADTGHPYASLITVATEIDRTPVTLISSLAVHRQNLGTDPRASILFASPGGPGDPLNTGRVSVMGIAEFTDAPMIRERFLARHPEAAFYVDFADFSFCRLKPDKAHYVGGFGRIATISADKFLLDAKTAQSWNAEIGVVIGQINDQRSDLVTQLACAQTGEPRAGWRLAACDPDGCDLVNENRSVRLSFAQQAASPRDVPEALSVLTTAATD
jgi:hypothetical protein